MVTRYETLASKSWQPSFCPDASLHIPPTIAVPVALIRNDPDRAAVLALERLATLDTKDHTDTAPFIRQQTDQATTPAASLHDTTVFSSGKKWSDVVRGSGELGSSTEKQHDPGTVAAQTDLDDNAAVVVKLGYSWEAVDVTKVQVRLQPPAANHESIARLGRALREAISAPGCRNDSVLVQRFIRACCELRLFVVDGVVVGRYLARYDDTTEHGKFQNWRQLGHVEAAAQWFGGDTAALTSAEADAEALVPRLLAALHGVCAAPIPAVRLDFLLERLPGAGRGRASTLEITEAGFSMCFWEEGPSVVFGAIVRACVIGVSEEEATAAALKGPNTRFLKRQREGDSLCGGRGKETAATSS